MEGASSREGLHAFRIDRRIREGNVWSHQREFGLQGEESEKEKWSVTRGGTKLEDLDL